MGNYGSEYAREVLRRAEERLNVKKCTLNETSNDIQCSINSKTLNDIKCTSNDFIAKSQYVKMLQTLESWNVFKPKTLTFKYGVAHCFRIFEYVQNTPNVKNKGAYFRKMLAA